MTAGATERARRIAEPLPHFLTRVRSLPEPGMLIQDLLPDEGVFVPHGRPRSMKSLTIADAMLSLALGEPYALSNPRFAIPAAAGVLWLGEEDSERLDAFRFGLMLSARGVEAPSSFRIVVRPGWDLETPAGQAALIETINDTAGAMSEPPLRVLVIDPARASLPSIDGGPKDAARGRAFLLELLRTTPIKVIVLLHHDLKPARDGKDDRSRAERASGGVTFSMADVMIGFERVDDRSTQAVPSMWKAGADPQPFRVRFESATPSGQGFAGFLRAVAETAGEGDAEREKVLRFVKANPWAPTREVDRGAGLRNGVASRVLAQLEAAGLVTSITGDKAVAQGRPRNSVLWGVS